MCSLVMSHCSRDLLVMSLSTIIAVINSTHSAWFLDGKTSTCLKVHYRIISVSVNMYYYIHVYFMLIICHLT